MPAAATHVFAVDRDQVVLRHQLGVGRWARLPHREEEADGGAGLSASRK